jgi:hypothetical protein
MGRQFALGMFCPHKRFALVQPSSQHLSIWHSGIIMYFSGGALDEGRMLGAGLFMFHD